MQEFTDGTAKFVERQEANKSEVDELKDKTSVLNKILKLTTKEAYNAKWLRVFYQDIHGGTILFDNRRHAKFSLEDDLYSILSSLEMFRMDDQKFEFLLEYPDIQGYNRWKQSSNPVATGSVSGYEAIHIDWSDSWGGMGISDSNNCLMDGNGGTSNWWYAIGINTVYQGGMPGPNTVTQKVCLWVRIA